MKRFPALLMLLSMSSCVIVRPALEGQVRDQVTGDPVTEISVRRVVSYKFLYSVGGNAQSGYLHDQEVYTDEQGAYQHPSVVRIMPPGGHSISDSISFGESDRYFSGKALSVNMGTWVRTASLVPKVTRLADCGNDVECRRQNALRARRCFLDFPYRDRECSTRSPQEWSTFFENQTDFFECNGKPDLEAINCIQARTSYDILAIPTELSCPVLDGELPRNYCYFLLADRSRFRQGSCERISGKEVPDSWVGNVADLGTLGAQLRNYRQRWNIQDFRSICLRLSGDEAVERKALGPAASPGR